MTQKRKGLIVSVYKPAHGDCSNGGTSSWSDQVLVVGDDIPEIFEAGSLNTVQLQPGNLPGTVNAVDVDRMGEPGEIGPMFGGCYIGSSDGRFIDAVQKITGYYPSGPVPLHDLFETQEQYDRLST